MIKNFNDQTWARARSSAFCVPIYDLDYFSAWLSLRAEMQLHA